LRPPPPLLRLPPLKEGAERETGAERVTACLLCCPRLLKVLVAAELCTPMNAPFAAGRLAGAAR